MKLTNKILASTLSLTLLMSAFSGVALAKMTHSSKSSSHKKMTQKTKMKHSKNSSSHKNMTKKK